jgi:RNA polymerase sigma factor (sigma-70 family)
MVRVLILRANPTTCPELAPATNHTRDTRKARRSPPSHGDSVRLQKESCIMDREQAVNQFVLASYGIVHAILLRRVGDRQAAEDLAQEAFLTVLRHGDFRPERPDALGFVLRAALWLARDRSRRLTRAPKPLSFDLADPHTGGPVQALEQEEDLDRVRRLLAEALGTLPGRDREMVLGFYARGRSVADLAQPLGLARQTVRAALSRSKKAILTFLGLPPITNARMRLLMAFLTETTASRPEALSTARIPSNPPSQGAAMLPTPSNRDHDDRDAPAGQTYPRPDKVEADTLLRRRRTLRSAIRHLLGLGWDPARHDRMMCLLTERSAGRISAAECDRRWAAFCKELGLDR